MGGPLWTASHSRGVSFSLREEAHQERTRWDPKDGELCLVRTKSGETLMEVRSDSDVQIDRRNWALVLYEFHPVKRMIRGIGVETASTYSQTLNG
jgi:hypothetical protein